MISEDNFPINNLPTFTPPIGYKFLLAKDSRSPEDCLECNLAGIVPGKNLIIRDELAGKFYLFDSVDHYEWYYYEYLHGDFLTHEVILGHFPQRPKWDVDGGDLDSFNEIVELIELQFDELYGVKPKFVICDSSGETPNGWKFSRHVIVANYAFANSAEANHFSQILRPNTVPIDEFVDWGVNKPVQNFRTVDSVKQGRRKQVISGPFDSTWITLCGDRELLPRLRGDNGVIVQNYTGGDIADDTVAKIVGMIDGQTWSFNRVEGNMLVFDRLRGSHCEICGREHTRVGMYVCIFADGAKQFCFRDMEKPKRCIALMQFDKQGVVDNKITLEKVIENIAKTDQEIAKVDIAVSYNIRDPKYKVYWSDYLSLIYKVHQNDKIIEQFVRDTIAFISNGGKPFYITKNRGRDFPVEYSMVKNIPKDIKFSFITPKGDFSSKKLTKIVECLHGEINYDRVEFAPYFGECKQERIFNTFFGYRHEYLPDFIVDETKFSLILRHIHEVIAAGDLAIENYFLNWLAHIIQRPNVKMGVAILLKSSSQGAGKNSLCNFIAKNVIGMRYCATISDIDQITGRFNSVLENKLFTICDEIQNFGGAYKSNDKLKSLITNETISIEHKGEERYEVADFNNYIFLTNNDWALKIEASDRRYLPLELSNKYAGDFTYFEALYSQLNDESGLHFFHWIARRDISSFKAALIPNTGLKNELKLNSVSKPILFLLELARGEIEHLQFGENELKISTEAFYGVFNTWCVAGGYAEKYTKIAFSREISKIITAKFLRFPKPLNGYQFTKEELVNSLKTFLKIEICDI